MFESFLEFAIRCLSSDYGITEDAYQVLCNFQPETPEEQERWSKMLQTVDATNGYYYIPSDKE